MMKKSPKCFVEYDTKEQICLSDVNRQIRFRYYPMFLLLCLFFACSSENDLTNEEPRELKLSVPLMDQEWLTTEKVDFEFEMDKSATIFEFAGVNNLSAFVHLKWGTKWVILGATDNILESVDVSQVLISTGKWSDYYVLSIKTVNEGKGSDIITLKNEEGDLAVVKVHIL